MAPVEMPARRFPSAPAAAASAASSASAALPNPCRPSRHLVLRKEYGETFFHIPSETATIVHIPAAGGRTLRLDQHLRQEEVPMPPPRRRDPSVRSHMDWYRQLIPLCYVVCTIGAVALTHWLSPNVLKDMPLVFLTGQMFFTFGLCWILHRQLLRPCQAALPERMKKPFNMLGIDAPTLAGARVWDASVVLIDELMDRHVAALQNGAHVIELGCGLGLPGMVCAALGAHVVLSDVPEAQSLLRRNIAANFGCSVGGGAADEKSAPEPCAGSAKAAALRWGTEAGMQVLAAEGRPFDFVICSDCVYEPLYGQSWKPLADTIEALCGPSTVVLTAVQRRIVEGGSDGVPHFLGCLSRSLVVERLCSVEADRGSIEVFAARRPATGDSPGLSNHEADGTEARDK
eukprot:gnl/TRDRNA2_/TRDRNA2_42996_c0_seq1.p1 gnl/TRDRNA2_/TRDRNA2_42996_c0~~gnl/TRDRNA2_/TRDRNA2_42996_c0_seq1.p1  ORF type:complete len:402 (-),score=64.97 gnl/TRDRNA2_/TRDRNA2_42996_c0_seq1:34-1239(-)